MGEIDNLIREKLREWQMRRLEIKDQMQSHPEMTLELSGVLDLMDEEHAAILNGSAANQAEDTRQQIAPLDRITTAEHPRRSVAGKLDLQLHVTAHSLENLRKLLDMAVYELQVQIEGKGGVITGEHRRYPGGMSGSLGDYHFELGINGEANHV